MRLTSPVLFSRRPAVVAKLPKTRQASPSLHAARPLPVATAVLHCLDTALVLALHWRSGVALHSKLSCFRQRRCQCMARAPNPNRSRWAMVDSSRCLCCCCYHIQTAPPARGRGFPTLEPLPPHCCRENWRHRASMTRPLLYRNALPSQTLSHLVENTKSNRTGPFFDTPCA